MRLIPARSTYTAKLFATGEESQRIVKFLGWNFPGLKYNALDDVTIPAEPRLFEYVLKNCDLVCDENVKAWYKWERTFEQDRADLLNHEDVVIFHERASKLYPYQRVGANFIANTKDCILADEPGLGKTAQTIVGVEMVNHDKVLVLCPNILKLHWKAEIEHWSQVGMPITVVDLKTRKQLDKCYGWFIVNYELFKITKWFQEQDWSWVVLDEAQNAKNRDTKLFKTIKSLRTDHHVLLSGTPFGNDPSELYTLLNIIDPVHYPSFWRFFELYVNYVRTPPVGYIKVIAAKNTDLLRRDLVSRMIQRKKSDVYSQLPAKIIRRLPVEISPLQKQVYTKAARSWLVECQGKPVTEIHNALSALLRLRQVISTPSCIVGEYGNPMPDDSAKLDTAMELIQSSSERIVVMSLFRGTVTALSERLSKAGIAHNVLMGGMGSGHAAECQRQINSGEIRVLVCTMQSGGTGLNLIGASTMIVIEEHYNPMIMWQCVDRIHRIGQTQQVYITILSCPGTVDDLVNKIVQRKITMSEAVLAESLTKNLQEFLS